MKVELSKTEIRAIIASIGVAAASTRNYSYGRVANKVFKCLQEVLGEKFDVDSRNWFKPGEPSKLKWGTWVAPLSKKEEVKKCIGAKGSVQKVRIPGRAP